MRLSWHMSACQLGWHFLLCLSFGAFRVLICTDYYIPFDVSVWEYLHAWQHILTPSLFTRPTSLVYLITATLSYISLYSYLKQHKLYAVILYYISDRYLLTLSLLLEYTNKTSYNIEYKWEIRIYKSDEIIFENI